MPVGFAATTQNANHAVKNFIRSYKKNGWERFDKTFIKESREDNYYHSVRKTKKQVADTVESLLTPIPVLSVYDSKDPNNLSILTSDNEVIEEPLTEAAKEMVIDNTKHRKTHLVITCGMFRIRSYWNGSHDDFTINVKIGEGKFAYHPRAIREAIVSKHGIEVYEEWKKLVRSEIDNLKAMIEIARSLTTKIIASTTSSESSKRLCKEVGLYVHGDTAFLLPKKFKY